MSVIEILQMVLWATDQVRRLILPKNPTAAAAEEVLGAIVKIYEAVDQVVYGIATPDAAKVGAQALVDSLVANDAAADAAAELKP